MNKVSGNPTPTDKLISRLRLMASAGGMLTRDRLRTISDAADRLEILDERVAIMTEHETHDEDATTFPIPIHQTIFNAMNDGIGLPKEGDET